MKKVAITLGSIFLLTAGLAWAGEPGSIAEAVDSADLSQVKEFEEGACDAAQPMPEDVASLTEWSAELGFAQVFATSEAEAAAPQCPAVISCNATHCIETNLCAVRDTGSSTCCTGFACLICPPGQTVKVQRCRCAGGGCLTANSQSFFCG